MFKIALDAGHHMGNSKRCLKKIDPNETREWWLNNRIAVKMAEKLKAYEGYELLRVDDTTGAKDVSLKNRCKAANNFKADIYFSIHHNLGIKGGSGGGITAYVWKKANAELLGFQKMFYNNLIDETGLKGNRATPLSKSNFTVLVNTNMKAVLVEHGFMDSTKDTPIILTEKFADQCATANVKSLVEIGGLKKKKTEQPVETVHVTYRAYAGKWWGEIVDCNDVDTDGYAGVQGRNMTALMAKPDIGTLRYRVHLVGKGWLPWVENYTDFAGIRGKAIDAVQMQLLDVTGCEVQYRVSPSANKGWYGWCTGLTDASGDGYAGVFGKPIDCIQIKIVKK